jgi:hypothetical protein
MPTGHTTLVTLRLELGANTIRGRLADEHGNERPFWGWLELSGALDELRGANARLDDPTNDADGTIGKPITGGPTVNPPGA